jgi:hypothetical protein
VDVQEALPHSPEIETFSLVKGGLIHGVRVRLKLATEGSRVVWREGTTAAALTWLPLLVLSLIEGVAFGHGIKIPFLGDYSTHTRFLITLPLLIAAESIIDPHIRESVRHFVSAGLVTRELIPAYGSVIRRTLRLRDSWVATLVLLLIAYGPSFWASGEIISVGETSTWHYTQVGTGPRVGWAGLWFSFVSIPLYRLILFRWLWLLIIWTVFLWRTGRLRLNCVASHPDRAGGLGFLTHTELFLGLVTFAISSSLAGAFANQLFYEGKTVSDLKFLMAGACALAIVFTVAPLLVLTPRLFKVKQRGLFEYGSLGVEYVDRFNRKWIRGERSTEDKLLGSADIQSLADLGNSHEIVHEMKIVLIDHEILLQLAIPALLPMLVLIATATPAEEILKALLHLLA